MKLPSDTIIAPLKLRDYLLVWRPEDDKSQWLFSAGYSREQWQKLEEDLRSQILPLDAQEARSTQFGQMYEIQGILIGPNGRQLRLRSFWMKEFETGVTKFITLYPDREV
jgi:hypothetical protein